jgi:formyl-CoA transferase
VGIPLTLSETPGHVQGPAPELGQHTEETLLALGYDWDRISTLRDKGVI